MNTDELADRVAIGELTARYNRAFDDGEVDAWLDTFVEDGEMQRDGRTWKGHDALARLLQKVGWGTVHVTTDAIVEIDGDRARQWCTLVLLRRERDRRPPVVLATGRYEDELRRTADGWRFVRRVASTDNDFT